MSNRLTATAKTQPAWTRLALPAFLLLCALGLLTQPDPYVTPLHPSVPLAGKPLFVILLCGFGGLLLRATLPGKSSSGVKTLAVATGCVFTFLFLLPVHTVYPLSALAAWAFTALSWLLFAERPERHPVWSLGSGLCAGYAVTLAPETLAGVIPLAIWNLFPVAYATPQTRIVARVGWIIFLAVGCIPLLIGTVPPPLFTSTEFFPPPLVPLLSQAWAVPPLMIKVLCVFGAVIALLQKQALIAGLILPTAILSLLIVTWLGSSGTQPDAGLLLCLYWIAGFGLLRVLRGLEQGVRQANPKTANRMPALMTLGLFLSLSVFLLISLWR